MVVAVVVVVVDVVVVAAVVVVVVDVDVVVVVDVLLESFNTLQTHNIVRKSNLKEAIFLVVSYVLANQVTVACAEMEMGIYDNQQWELGIQTVMCKIPVGVRKGILLFYYY